MMQESEIVVDQDFPSQTPSPSLEILNLPERSTKTTDELLSVSESIEEKEDFIEGKNSKLELGSLHGDFIQGKLSLEEEIEAFKANDFSLGKVPENIYLIRELGVV